MPVCACAVEFSAAENHLTPYSDDSLSPPDIAKACDKISRDLAKCDEAIDVVAVDRRMARPEVT